ncbi:hypothetical protein, partial [Klebsiella pneumoniae]|uniref:hypothetical protein n=1 Tax=Klebsiella pneumoniae TaxID=573 RepID=UPI0013D28A3C
MIFVIVSLPLAPGPLLRPMGIDLNLSLEPVLSALALDSMVFASLGHTILVAAGLITAYLMLS